jgi:uncharacterized cupredoxin-like copper-binding protein
MFVQTFALLAIAAAPGLVRGPAPHTTSAKATPVTVVATDFSFSLPATLAAGPTAFTLVNHGKQAHHFFLIRLEGGHTTEELVAGMKSPGPPPPWAVFAGGPNAVDPGGTSFPTVVDLRPGNYAIICIIPGPDAVPHVMKGMSRSLHVTGAAARPASLAVTRDTITLTDYAFSIPWTLHAGTTRVTVRDAGSQPHELVVVHLDPGKSPQDVASWVDKMAGPPPGHFLGGVSPIAPGQVNDLVMTLTPGRYALMCFVPDAKDGKPHVAHGMMREVTITR